MATIKDKIDDLNKFKNKYEKEVKNISFNDFNNLFYVQGYFYVNKTPYGDERFYDVLFEITSNIIKARLQELEYYTNLKPQTPTTNIESETISNSFKTIQAYCYKFQIYHKTIHKMGMLNQNNSPQTIKFLEAIYNDIKEFRDYSSKLQDKFIKNFKSQLEELESNKPQIKYESSMYN